MKLGSLFSTATSFLGGIQTYLIVGTASLAIGFGSGYYLAVNQAEKNASVAPVKAATAQKKHDDQTHEDANQVSNVVAQRHDAEQARTDAVLSALARLQPPAAPKECPEYKIPASVIHQLNEAGR